MAESDLCTQLQKEYTVPALVFSLILRVGLIVHLGT